jgi:hypothetical protein
MGSGNALAFVREGFDSGKILGGQLGNVTLQGPEYRDDDRRAVVRLGSVLRFPA